MKTVFGPVPSRRLGQSLGIDPVPLKTCNWNCVYCQLGRSQPLVHEQKEYFPREDIILEVEQALASHAQGEIDWLTFVGSGETTLHSSIGWLIRQVKTLTPLPVAVITNGSLLYLEDVRLDLSLADAVLPSLDAGSAQLYREINRPHPEATFERLVDGLIAFREIYRGKLWVEVMLVRGLNDTPEALRDIAEVMKRIGPDAVHINLPTRPPVESWVEPPTDESLMQAMAILGDIAEVVHPAEGSFDLSGYDNPIDAVIGIITRHPMRQEELERSLARWAPGQVSQALADLLTSGRAQVVERYGVRFWSAAPSHYPDKTQSLRTIPGRHQRHENKVRDEKMTEGLFKPLNEVPAGKQVLVRQLRGGKDFTSRMEALGVTEGAEVEVIQNDGVGPLIGLVQNFHVTLGRGEALKVLVEEVSNAHQVVAPS